MSIKVGSQTFYRTSEAAKMLKVNTLTILRWIGSKRIHASKIGKSYVIAEEELLRVLKGQETPGQPELAGSAS